MRLPASAIAMLLITGCASKSVREQAVDPPPWSTPSGKEQTRLELADRLIDAGAHASALDLVTLARVDGASGPELDLLTGRALYGQGLMSEAEIHLDQARARLRSDPRPLRAIALVYADTDRPLQAIEALRRATDLDPNHAKTWNNLGYLLHSVQRDPGAVPALQKAVSLDSQNPRYKRNLGFALFSDGRPDDAMNAFSAAGPPADAWYNLGVAYELAGDADQARTRFEKALQYDPNHTLAQAALRRLNSPEAP